jgi:DNA-binding CsgD family transcriptional regulator
MPKLRTVELLCLIPENASFRQSLGRDGSEDAEIELLAEADNDPAVRAKFVDAFVEVRQPLPASIDEPELLRAYGYRRFGTPDADVEAAFTREHDLNTTNRTRLRCMLLRPEYTYAEIGKKMGLSEDTVRIYQALFWPVRDRGGFFVTSLVYPRSRQCEFEPGYPQNETTENLAYRAALTSGMEAVERLLGMNNTIMKKTINEMADHLARRILANAESVADMGCLNQDMPGLKNALAVMRMLKPGRRRQQEVVAIEQLNPMSVAAAVSESLGQPAVVPNRWSWPCVAIATGASDQGSVGQTFKKSAAAGEEIRRPKRAKSRKTATRLSMDPKVQIDKLDAAA